MNTFYSHFINKASALRLASMLSLMVIFFAVGVGAAYGQTTYHVSTDGDDNFNGLTATESGSDGPKATIQSAIDAASDGDIISVETGDYSEGISISKRLAFKMVNSGTQDTISVTDFRITANDTVTFNQGDNTANRFVVQDSVALGVDKDDKARLILADNTFKINNGQDLVINGDSTTVSGTFLFPENISVTYLIERPFTVGDELPADLGTGTLSIEADSSFTLTDDLIVGALDVNSGTGGTHIQGGKTITIGNTVTGTNSAIDDRVTANIVFAGDQTFDFTINDTLNGSVSFASDAENTVNLKTSSDTAMVTGGITTSVDATLALKMASEYPLELNDANFTANGSVSADTTAILYFTGSSPTTTFSPGASTNRYGGIKVNKTGSGEVTVANSITFVAEGYVDTAMSIVSGTLDFGSNSAIFTGDSAVVKNSAGSGAFDAGGVRFINADDNARPKLIGLGFPSITVNLTGNSGARDLYVSDANDSTTYSGALRIVSGGVIAEGKDFSPTTTGSDVFITFTQDTSISTASSGTFNGLNTRYDLTYDGTIDTDYNIGSEWSDYVDSVKISVEGTGPYSQSLMFSGGLNISSTGVLTADSTANPIVIAGRSSNEDGENDTLKINGKLDLPIVSADKQPKFVARGDTMFFNFSSASELHTIGAKFDEESNGSDNDIIFNVSASSNIVSNSDEFDGEIQVSSKGNTLNFEDVTVDGEIRMDSSATVTAGTFGSLSDSLIIGYRGSFTFANDSVDFSSGVRVDSFATLSSGTQVLRFNNDDTKALYAPSSATLDGTGAYRFIGGSSQEIDVNGNDINSVSVDKDITIVSNLNVTSALDVNSDFELDDTLTVTDAAVTLGGSIENTGAEDDNFFISNGSNFTVEGSQDSLATLKSLGESSFSATIGQTVHILDSLILGGGTLSIGDNVFSLGAGAQLTTRGGAITMNNGNVSFATTSGSQNSVFANSKGSSNDSLYVKNFVLSPDLTDTVGIDGVELRVGNLTLSSENTNGVLRLNDSSTVTISDQIILNDSTAGVVGRSDSIKFGNSPKLVLNDAYSVSAQDSLLHNKSSFGVVNINMDASEDSLILNGSITVNDSLIINDGGIATTADDYTISLGDGAVVQIDKAEDPIVGDKTAFVTSDDYTLILKANNDLNDDSLLVNNEVSLVVDGVNASTVDLPEDHTQLVDITIGASDALKLNSDGDTLTVSGSVDFGGTATNEFGGSDTRLVFDGNTAQTFTTADTMQFQTLSINNSAGVTLDGSSDIRVSTDLELLNGDFNLGGNTLKLPQGDTDQGYSGADSTSFVVNGLISKEIFGGEDFAAQRNYVSYPLGVAGTDDFRPLDLWFNTDPVDDVTVSVGHVNSSPNGTVFESSASDAGVEKYPDFYWTVQSSQDLSSSYAYEVNMEAQGYALLNDQDIDAVKVIHRASGDSSNNKWKLLSSTYNNSVNADDVPIVKATAAVGGIESTEQFFTYGLGADVVYSDTLPTFQLTEGGREGIDTLNVADLDTVFESSSSLTFSVDTGTVNARIDENNILRVFADTMDLEASGSYLDSLTITATDGFNPITALLQVQVNPSPFVKDGAVRSYTLTADSVEGNTADISSNPKKIALTDIFGGGSDSLFYQIIDTTTNPNGPFFSDNSTALSSDNFIDVSNDTRDITRYAQALDDTLRIQALSDTVLTEANAIAIRVTDGQVFEDDTVYVNFTSVQAQTLADTVDNFDLTINGSDTTFSLAKWVGGFGGTNNLDISVFRTSGDSGAVLLDTLADDEFTFTPSDDSTGTVTFKYRSTDQNGVTNDDSFTVTTLDSVIFDSTLTDFQTDAANGDTVIFNLDTLVAKGDGNYEFTTAFTKENVALASISEDTLTITPRDSGVTDLILTATDGNGGFAHDTVQITITGTTFIPAFDSALSEIATDTVLLEGEEFEFTYSATSTDSADMIYKFAGVTPSGASLDSTTGLLTWTPTSFGEYSIRVTAFNANNREYNFTDEAQVSVINAPSFIAELGDTTVATGDTLTFTFAADPYDGGSIESFELDSTYDDSASISSTGKFQFIPGVTYNGDYNFTVTVTDDKGASATNSFTVNVTQTQPWGDVTGNGVMNATDATNVLRHVVGLDKLSGADSVLANVSGAGGISSLDASLILRKVADSTYDFPVEREGNLKAVPATGEFTLANMSGSGEDELALNLNVDQTSGVKALTVTINYDAGLNELTAIESALPEGWMFFYNDVQEEGVIKISAAGTSELTNRDELITLRFNTMNVEMPSSVNADVTMNEESTSPLADVLLQAIPSEFALNQNYPNPFNPTTNIKFALPQSSVVKLEVFNVLGQRVATLVNGELNAGYHTVMFDASNLASGVYVYRINTSEHMQVKRMMLIK